MIRVGLTGSIGMGKSTVASMFRDLGVPVFDADAEVFRVQGPGGAALAAIEARFPGTTGPGGVDRACLASIVLKDDAAMRALEAIVHPMVADARAAFIRRHGDEPVVVFDIPLLYETGGEAGFDHVVVVSAPPAVQRARVMAREGMTAEKFAAILARQLPDDQKRARADFIISTAGSLHETRQAVEAIVTCLRGGGGA